MKITQMTTRKKMGRYGWKPDIIVNHITEGGYSGAVGWLANGNSEVSCHFVTSRNGDVAQLVPIEWASWCNGTQWFNKNQAYYTERALSALVRERKTNANYYTVSIEHEGWTGKTDGKLTDKQYQATLELHKHIITEIERIYKFKFQIDREHIIGHVDVSPREKPTCPGKYFPFDKLINDLRAWRRQGPISPHKPKSTDFNPNGLFNARIICDALNIRRGPGTQYKIEKQLPYNGVYTVTEEKNGWGRLKSCKDWWICLDYVKKEKI